MSHPRRNASWAGRVLLVLAIAVTSCKRTRAPKVDEVWNEAPAQGQAEALGGLAPPWRPPTRAVLDSGLITFWLHEAEAPTTHVRLLLPVGDDDRLRSAAMITVLQAHLRQAAHSRAQNRGMRVDTRSAPDRIELAIHASVEDSAPALNLLAHVLGSRAPAAGLEAARAEVLGQLKDLPSSDERATAALAATLLGRAPENQGAQRSQVEQLSREGLVEAWQALVDPRRAVLVVHSGEEASLLRPALRMLAERWRGFGRRPVPPSAIARLRATSAPPSSNGRLLAEPATPLRVLPGPEGTPVLMLGRVIPTRSATDRSLARLAQRIVQEELDARLVIRGDYGLFIVRVPLGREPERSATEAIEALTAFATTREPQQRWFQAAQLWLGARVVQASLDGEDWTSLWSDAIDLAENDEAIAGALARDAKAMLEPDPEVLQAWLQTWLDPRDGEPGWSWMVAGASERQAKRLARITSVQEARSGPAQE